MGRPRLRTPEENRRWLAFYQTRWQKDRVRRGFCRQCARKRDRRDRQFCATCRKQACARAAAQYERVKAARQKKAA
jgi:hypothetical protein